MPHRARVIGTTPAAIARAEAELGRSLPQSFRAWLLANNGRSLDSINVFPVLDERDRRKTWSSIVHENEIWRSYCEDVFPDESTRFEQLIAFADFGTGDYYCFDYSNPGEDLEAKVVHWSHETGDSSPRAASFTAFAHDLAQGRYKYD